VLSLVDGVSSCRDIVEACLLPAGRTTAALDELAVRGVIYIDRRVE
jgi:hypothetical protein